MREKNWFISTLRRHFACRDQYHHLEKFLEGAPPEVLGELDILRRKIEDLVATSESNRRVTSRNKRLTVYIPIK